MTETPEMSEFERLMQEALDESQEDFEDVETRECYEHGAFNKYSGSKWHSLPHLMPRLPYRRRFVEVFGGSGIVTRNRKSSPVDIFNDRHSGIVAFFKVLRDDTLRDKLIDKVRMTLYSREDFITFKHEFYSLDDTNVFERAYQWYCMVQMSYGGLARTFQKSKSHSVIKNLWSGLPDLEQIARRFRNVTIENLDWRTCIQDYDSEDTVFYLDPPYFDSNVYKLKMSRGDHFDLCELIHNSKGFFALSGFDNPIYQQFPWTSQHSWMIKDDDFSTVWNRREHLWIKD